MDYQVSEHVSPLGCICLVLIRGYRLLQGILGTEHLLQNYINVTVTSKRRVVNTFVVIMSMYMLTLLKQLKMTVMYNVIGATGIKT